MRWIIPLAAVLIFSLSAHAAQRERLLMDANWWFTLNDPADAGKVFDYPESANLAKAAANDIAREQALTAQQAGADKTVASAEVSYATQSFDNGQWRHLNLPHDWVVELGFDQTADNSHGSRAIGPKIGNTIGWYRRTFGLPASDKGRVLTVEFDGVYRNSLVWINGHLLGRNASGYTGFSYDISRYANYGGTNVLAVRVDATRTEGWFYEGAGIYRHVWLVKTDPVHVAHWGTYVTTDVEGPAAHVLVRTTIRNETDKSALCIVNAVIRDAAGKEVASAKSNAAPIPPGAERTIAQSLRINEAKLWSIETPNMYHVQTDVQSDGADADSGYITPFGVRTIRFDANEGFFLNGKHVFLAGTCNHQDHAGVGSALPDRLQYFRIEKLKEMGSNALRTSHNDPTPELLDACDKLGMVVMDEHRQLGWDHEHLEQIHRQVLRDRNHPSVILWSLANEEGLQGGALGTSLALAEEDLFHRLDPSRLCTEAMNNAWGTGVSDILDVQGFNYLRQGGGGGGGGAAGRGATVPTTVDGYTAMDRFHAAYPNKPAVGTEEASTLSTRGQYADDRSKSFETAYDLDNPRWGTTAEQWLPYYLKRKWVSGAFVWTGFDYRGEPTPYRWPAVSSQFGIMDTCGFPKDIYYYYQANWTDKPVVHLLPHWNWKGQEGKPIDVWCFSNMDSVELFLNGRSLGKQTVNVLSHLDWKVPYEPGTLEARGYRGDQLVQSDVIKTSGDPTRIVLTTDRPTLGASGEDVSVVTVSVTDADGNKVPTATNLIKFTITGGNLIGVGNGDPGSHESDKAPQRQLFAGLCQAIVQSTKEAGTITLSAAGDGLPPVTLDIQVQPAMPRPSVP